MTFDRSGRVSGLYVLPPAVPPYQGGPIFDISGHAGALTAQDIQGSERSVSGATLEDLVAAVRQIPDLPADDSMFRWVRQVASLPAALP